MAIQTLYPTIKPSLNLDFANTKALDPRITFTRTTTGTRTNASGVLVSAAIDAPRFDYNPSTLAPLGLLIEEQRTNLLTYSEQFDNAAWGATQVTVTANTSVSPNGATTADTITADGTTNPHYISAVDAIGAKAISVFAKAGTGRFFQIAVGGTAEPYANFDLTAGTSTAFGTGTTASITAFSNGWYRCAMVTTNAAASAVRFALVSSTSSARLESFTSSATILLWGAQSELGAFATSYIPTTTAQVTRAADVASMTGTNFSSWYNQTEGTLFAEYAKYANVSSRIATISNNTANNQIRLNGSVSTAIRPDWQIVDGNVVQANVLAVNTVAPNVFAKTAGAYVVNSFNQATNAVLGTEDTSGTVPSVSQMNIGANEGGAASLNGHIRNISYYPRRLSNAELQAITS
jgi:hypothetical protein